MNNLTNNEQAFRGRIWREIVLGIVCVILTFVVSVNFNLHAKFDALEESFAPQHRLGVSEILVVGTVLLFLLLIFYFRRTKELREEISKRQEAEEELQEARDNLEVRVQRRSIELARANVELREEVAGHKKSEESLAKSELKYKTLVENLPQMVFLKDRNSVYLSCNLSYAESLCIAPEDIVGKTDYEFFPRDLADKYRQDDQRIMAAGEIEDIEERYIRDGKEIFIHTVKVPIKDKSGMVNSILGIFWDISEAKKSADEIKNLNRRIEFILGATKTGLDIIDSNYNVRYIDSEWAKVYGDYTGKKCYEYFMGTSKVCQECGVTKALQIKETVITEEVLPREGNRPVQVITMPFQDEKGDWLVAEVNVDISERKRIEDELKKYQEDLEGKLRENSLELVNSEARYRRLFETAKDGILLLEGETGRIIDVNPFLVEMLGYPQEDFLGKQLWEIGGFKDVQASREAVKELQAKEYIRYDDLPLVAKNGQLMEVEFVSNVYLVGGQKVIQCNIRDISQRRKIERIAAEALKAKEDFTAKISHELRTPLAAMKEGIAQVLDETAGAINKDQRYVLDLTKRNVDRLARLINNILDLQKLGFHEGDLNFKENDINQLIKETQEMLILMAQRKGLDFRLELGASLPRIKFDRDKIAQVLTNLISNAVNATKKGGITISSRQGENFIEVAVYDTGEGIKKENMGSIFKPFWQENKKIGGTGLGLSICQEIIQAHNGKIWVESEFGKGAVFYFSLPINERRGKNGKKYPHS